MCGICGELRFDGRPPERARLERMTQRLARRGPDARGEYLDGPVALGHRRLAVIDLSARAAQPMHDVEHGLVLVFNGTIYNYPELRAELLRRGHRFVSDGDTEVILKAYAEWGESCTGRLYGVFAFAIWERRRQRLFLARDRLGIKPLYYSINNGCLRFASTTQALLAAGEVDTGFDPVALHQHLSLHAVVPAPRTLLRGIRKLPPAHGMSVTPQRQRRVQRYWRLEAGSSHAGGMSEWEWIEAAHEALKQAVKKRLDVADVPVGLLLSGGLDSSLLVALLAEAGVGNLLTFSVGFEDEPEEKGSEFEFSDLVAELYDTRHHRITIPNSEVLARLPEAVEHMTEPMVGQDAVAFYLLSECVSKQVKVVQSGQGADEVFGGYFWYPLMQQAQGSDIERFRPLYFDRDHEEIMHTLDDRYHGPDWTTPRVQAGLAQSGAQHFINRVLAFDVTTLVVDDPVKRVDNMTMAWGLEARVPFLDQHLVELVAGMPPGLKLRSGGKHPLKMIARDLLPDIVIDRPKGYFPLPALKFVRGRTLEFMRAILDSEACRSRGLFRRECVERLLASPDREHTPIRGNKLWHLALLELWLQRNVDGCGSG